VDEKAPRMSLRLRGTSFDHYDGKRWTRSASQAQLLTTFDRENYTIRRHYDPERDQRLQIVLDHLDEPVVFLPYGTVALRVPARLQHAQKVTRELTGGPGLDIRYEDPDELGLMYTAYVSKTPGEADLPPLPSERRARYLQLPEGHERVAELAKELTLGATSDLESAQRIVRYLQSDRYKYSLELPAVKNQQPLEAFLFDQKRGHCEYFASAMAILLRSVDIPARNVTGFVGGRYNPYGGYYALRQGDAHSWVEAYIDGRGWVTYDPTPPLRAELGPKISLWADLQAFMDALKTRWLTSVVGYDLRTQVSMLKKLAQFFSSSGEKRDSGGGSQGQIDFSGLKRAGRGLALLLVAAGFLGLAWYTYRRRVHPGKKDRPLTPQVADAVRLYRDLERALNAGGQGRPPGATPLEHAQSLEETSFSCAAEVRQVTEAYMRVRYGGGVLPEQERLQLRAAIARVRKAPKLEAAQRKSA
jgi:transglutaminase-like putative cysteine protease